MPKAILVLLCSLLGALITNTASAQLTWAQGTVVGVGAYPPGSSSAQILFSISDQPTTTCTYSNDFAISLSTTTAGGTDRPEVRADMLAILLSAKASGSQVRVMYDPAGGCDPSGFVAVYAIWTI